MPRTTGRTLELLGLLQSRAGWTGTELRRRLGVSERTLRRDIDDLRALGYGIEATRGVGGRYRLGPGAAVPPLALASDEAVAIAIGLRTAAAGIVTGIEDAAARALAKLEQSLAPGTREKIADVERAMVPLAPGRDDIDVETVAQLTRAIAQRHPVRLVYRRHDREVIEPTVQPHRIVHTLDRWYLVAWDASHRNWRTLRVDRIERLRTLPDVFAVRDIPDEALRRFTSHSISVAPYPVTARIRVHAPLAAARTVFGATVARLDDAGDGTTLLVTGANRAEEIVLYLGISGFSWDLLEGEEVREALTRLAADFARVAAG